MSHLSRVGNPNIFATLPFDQIDGVAGAWLHDDFTSAITVADFTQAGAALQSDLNWWGEEIAANDCTANALVLPGEVDHAGILQLQSGTDTPAADDGVSLQLGSSTAAVQDTLVLDTNGVYIAGVLRFPDVSDQDVEFGLIGQEPEGANAGATDVVAFAWDPADVANVGDEFFLAQVNAAGTDTEVVSTLAYVENDWVLLEIGADTSEAQYRITTEDGSETMVDVSAAMPTVALRPVFSTTVATGTDEQLLDLDLFHMRYLRRSELTGNGSDWLGA